MTEARGVWARIELLGMLFAAGRGKRMRPLSDVMPKPALPVAGRPLAHLAVHNLRRAGVDEAHANTWHLADAMEEVLETIGGTGFNLFVHREQELLGTAGGLRNALGDHPAGPVLAHNGDVLYVGDLKPLIEQHHARRALATLGLVRVADRSIPRSVILAPDGHVDAFRREPIPPPDAWTFTGIHVLSPELFARLPRRGCIVADCYAGLVNTRRIVGVPLDGVWADIGTPSRYKAIHRQVLGDQALLAKLRPDLSENRTAEGVAVHPRARVKDGAVLLGPSAIDMAAEIDAGATIGPGSFVGAGARVLAGVEVRNAVIFPGSIVAESVRDAFFVDGQPMVAHPPDL